MKETSLSFVLIKINLSYKLEKANAISYKLTILLNDRTSTSANKKQLNNLKTDLKDEYKNVISVQKEGYSGFALTSDIDFNDEQSNKDLFTNTAVQSVQSKSFFKDTHTVYIDPSTLYDKNLFDYSVSYSVPNSMINIKPGSEYKRAAGFTTVHWTDKKGADMLSIQYETLNKKNIILINAILLIFLGLIMYKRKRKKVGRPSID